MKRRMTIEYLKCRAHLNCEVDFGVNGTIGTIVTKWDLIYSDSGSFSSIIYIYIFKYASYVFNKTNAKCRKGSFYHDKLTN